MRRAASKSLAFASSASRSLISTAKLALLKEKVVIREILNLQEGEASSSDFVQMRVGTVDLAVPSTHPMLPNASMAEAEEPVVQVSPTTGEYTAWTIRESVSEDLKAQLRLRFKQKPGHPNEVKIQTGDFM